MRCTFTNQTARAAMLQFPPRDAKTLPRETTEIFLKRHLIARCTRTCLKMTTGSAQSFRIWAKRQIGFQHQKNISERGH